jgi:hypothetical protein
MATASLSTFVFHVALSVPGQARGYHGQFAQAYRASARPVRTSGLYLVPFLYIEALGGG